MEQRVVGPGIAVHTSGEVFDDAREYVQRRITSVVRRVAGDVDAVRVRLTRFRQSSAARPALVQVNLTVDGRLVRAQAAAAFFREAAVLLRTRVRDQVTRLARPGLPRPWPEAYRRHTQRPSVAVPSAQRTIVRDKRYPLSCCRPDEAALTMDVMDYDFHLFVDADTGQDSLAYRIGPTGYRLARLRSLRPQAPPVSMPWTINVHDVPQLTPAQAVERLDATELPFRFFQDTATGRGSVVYHRYDGHYGLLTAANMQPAQP